MDEYGGGCGNGRDGGGNALNLRGEGRGFGWRTPNAKWGPLSIHQPQWTREFWYLLISESVFYVC